MATATTRTGVLTRLYHDETIVVGSTTGKEMLAASGEVFPGWLDPNFERWGTNVQSDPTEEAGVEVWEMAEDANFRTMFSSLGDPERLCLTQGQIRKFAAERRDKLHSNGWATFFLFRVGEELFVAGLDDYGRELLAFVYRFGNGYVWCAGDRRRVVVPRLD